MKHATNHIQQRWQLLKKRILIKLSTFENNSFETIKIISPKCFEELKKDCERINLIHSQLVVFKLLQLNGIEYSKLLSKFNNIPVSELNIQNLTSSELLLHTNRTILNLLTSFRIFIDNADCYLKRKYGKKSEIDLEFQRLRSHHIDKTFGYRFLNKLRDYILHQGFPIKGLHFKAKKNISNPEKMIGEVLILIEFELIKNEKGTFGNRVHKEILELNEDIDIRPLIVDLSKSIKDIQEFIYSIQKEEIDFSISNIEMLVNGKKTKTNEIKVFYGIERSGEEVSFNVFDVPFSEIEDIKIYNSQK